MSDSSLSAAVAYKKQQGRLVLEEAPASTKGKEREQALVWTTGDESTALRIPTSKLRSLFASKDGGAKVMIRIAVESNPGQPETLYNFTFTSGASAVSDRESFKRDLAAIVATNREQPAEAPAMPAPTSVVVSTSQAASADPEHLQDSELKRRVLDANPELKRLFSQLVVKERRLTESDFWENRRHLLEEERFVAGGQRKGRGATFQGPQLQTTTAGETRISVTPEIIREIFEEYPVVQRAYHENVPPLSESDFWSRYFQSKLFAQTRSTTRTAGETAKADAIFDRYLGDEDDELEPKHLQAHEIHRLLDLAATASDHVESGNQADLTMRAGSLRSSLPLMRRFNERSERLLQSALGDEPNKRRRMGIDAGDAGSRDYYHQIEIEDLQAQRIPSLVQLAVTDPRLRSTKKAGSTLSAEAASAVRSTAREYFSDWHPTLSAFGVNSEDARIAANDTMAQLGQRNARTETAMLPQSTLNAMTACQSATMEYLRHYWAALSPDAAANARLTPAQRAAKAQRMIGYLARTQQRVDAIIAEAKGVESSRIEAALGPVLESARAARDLYHARTAS